MWILKIEIYVSCVFFHMIMLVCILDDFRCCPNIYSTRLPIYQVDLNIIVTSSFVDPYVYFFLFNLFYLILQFVSCVQDSILSFLLSIIWINKKCYVKVIKNVVYFMQKLYNKYIPNYNTCLNEIRLQLLLLLLLQFHLYV